MPIKAPLVQASLDPLFSRARTANSFTEQPTLLALLEQACTVL